MIFWIFVAILVAGIIWKIFDEWSDGAFALIIIGALATGVCLAIMPFQYLGVDGYVAENNTRYETLVYQYENNIYDNDNDLGKRELMVDIQDWNEDLARHQENQDDFWIGIFIPNVYDQFDYIELK